MEALQLLGLEGIQTDRNSERSSALLHHRAKTENTVSAPVVIGVDGERGAKRFVGSGAVFWGDGENLKRH